MDVPFKSSKCHIMISLCWNKRRQTDRQTNHISANERERSRKRVRECVCLADKKRLHDEKYDFQRYIASINAVSLASNSMVKHAFGRACVCVCNHWTPKVEWAHSWAFGNFHLCWKLSGTCATIVWKRTRISCIRNSMPFNHHHPSPLQHYNNKYHDNNNLFYHIVPFCIRDALYFRRIIFHSHK